MMRTNDVGPDFFHTLGVPVVLGREFVDADTATSQPSRSSQRAVRATAPAGQEPAGTPSQR